MTLNKVLKPTNTSSLQKHSVRSLSDMMGDFDSSDDENVENLPPLPNDQVSWEYWQCCCDADAHGESSTLIGSTCLSSMLTKTLITTDYNIEFLFRLVSSALIGWTSLASGCTTLSPCPLFQAAGWFWWLSDRILFNSNLGSWIFRFREQRRNLEEDVEVIAKAGITDVMVLMQVLHIYFLQADYSPPSLVILIVVI